MLEGIPLAKPAEKIERLTCYPKKNGLYQVFNNEVDPTKIGDWVPPKPLRLQIIFKEVAGLDGRDQVTTILNGQIRHVILQPGDKI